MGEKQKILIVDDRRQNLLALRKVLSDLDVEIIEATSGNEALAATLIHVFAVAILDVMMPEMDGYELAGYIRGDAKTRNLPIIFLTAVLSEEERIFRGYEVGAVDYIVKPYHPAVLLSKVRVFLELEKARAQLAEKIDALTVSEQALRESEERFRLLSDTAGCLLAAEHPQEIVNDLCRRVMKHLDCHAFFNFLVDEDAGRLHLNACAGISEEEIRKIEWLDYGVAVCGCVARDAERIVAEEIGQTPDPRTELIRSYGITAYACHPLMVQTKLIGTLSFGTRSRTRFSPDALALMKTVTDQVATAMERMRLIKELRNSRDKLEVKVQERTAELKRRAEQLSLLASELTLAEERQRRRLAEILHDHLQQILVGAKLNLETLSHHIPGIYQSTYRNVSDLLMQSIQTSRSLTAELSPSVLYTKGLASAMEWLARWMEEKYALTVRLQMDSEIILNQEAVAVLLFQSVRELLFNIVKHAGVSSAAVDMHKENDNRLRIVIRDRGAGFDPGRIGKADDPSGGFGLFSIRERLEFLGGRLEVESSPGKGARFTLIAPMERTRPLLP